MKLTITLVALTFAVSGFAQVDQQTAHRAAEGAVRLRSMMKDPDSFVLESVYLLKADKKGSSEICYYYNAKNSYGGYTNGGEAQLLKNGRIYDIDAETRNNSFFALFDPCKPAKRVADLTADVIAILDPSKVRIADIKSTADRPKMIAAENASFKKEGVAGYAEIVGDTYIVHSERCTAIRFHANMVQNTEWVDALKRAGITFFVYTDDADKKFMYDVKAGKEVSVLPPEPSGQAVQGNQQQ